VPYVRFGRLASKSGFKFGEVINKVVCHPPHRFVRCVRSRRLPLDGDLKRVSVPSRPGLGQLEHVVHHAGDDIGRMPAIDRWSDIGH
jgi:hypothetical protein